MMFISAWCLLWHIGAPWRMLTFVRVGWRLLAHVRRVASSFDFYKVTTFFDCFM